MIGTHWGKIHLLDHDGNKIMTREYVRVICYLKFKLNEFFFNLYKLIHKIARNYCK